jgi:hippurate hydrolase
MHVTCLLGAAATLAARRNAWRGTLLLVFQPAEEIGRGARAMVDDGLFDRFGSPDVVLGQHVGPLPAGTLGLRPGPAFATMDSLRVVLHGRGAHGSRPEASVDPVVMAAATVMRLQGIVSREVAGTDVAVVTVGAVRAGTKENIIPDSAELLLSARSYDDRVHQHLLAAIERIVRAEAAASGALREPEITSLGSFPSMSNDPDACARTQRGFDAEFGPGRVLDPGLVTASEDVGVLAEAAGAPLVYWILGGADPAAFAGAATFADMEAVVRGLPSNHSPLFAPVVEPTLDMGVRALVSAVHTWLPADTAEAGTRADIASNMTAEAAPACAAPLQR